MAQRLVLVLGPCIGLLGLAHLMDRRYTRGLLMTLTGILLLADVAQNVRVASMGEAQRLTAVSAAFSTWLYAALAMWELHQGWMASAAPATALPARAPAATYAEA